MGVAGAGKTTIGTRLASRLEARFIDADDLHPAANVAKMAAGQPLTDADRWPWLARTRQVLRTDAPIVVTCSALKRRYRDLLRQVPGVRFVFLDLDTSAARERTSHRSGHFMRSEMVESQFAAMERPGADEPDVLLIDATGPIDVVVENILARVGSMPTGFTATPLLADGALDRDITDADLAAHVATLTTAITRHARRVLLVPPDHTRLHSRAGVITVLLRDQLRAVGCDVGVLPALGTHVAMDDDDAALLFDGRLSAGDLLVHEWRRGLEHLGEISADEVGVVTGGRFAEPIEVAVDRQLLDGWDAVVSIGQVVPHEVIGMANFTKNLVIGLGGAPTIHRSHFVGAVADMERIMGRATSPVRDIVDAAFDRLIAPVVSVLWVLTVVEDVGSETVLRGLYAGTGSTAESGGAAFRAAAALARHVNVDIVDGSLARVVCRLDEREFRSTWLGNKAVYRTRMAIADGGELVVLAPGVQRFGEDEHIDALIRRHGYRGTPAVVDGIRADADLAANLGAAAHLIHGSSEGRFRIVYCTDPEQGGLGPDEIESVGYLWRPLAEELAAARRRERHRHGQANRSRRQRVLLRRQPGSGPLGHGGSVRRGGRVAPSAGPDSHRQICLARAWTQPSAVSDPRARLKTRRGRSIARSWAISWASSSSRR